MDESYEKLLKKRNAEEQRLIQELRRKRACVRLAPALPTEEDVQMKIKNFITFIITTIKSHQLEDEVVHLFAQKQDFFGRRETALYKCKVEIAIMRVNHLKEKILSMTEALSMAYETYGLLILAKTATEESRSKFYSKNVEGVSIDPTFVAELTRKELDYFDELIKRADSEIHQAEQHLATQENSKLQDEIMTELSHYQQRVQEMDECIQSGIHQLGKKLQEREQTLGDMMGKVQSLESNMNKIQAQLEEIKTFLKAQGDAKKPVDSEEKQETQAGEPPSEGMWEDLLELDYEEAYEPSEHGHTPDSEKQQPECSSTVQGTVSEGASKEVQGKSNVKDVKQEEFEKRDRELQREMDDVERRLSEILQTINSGTLLPPRLFTRYSRMREEERFLRCAFCDAKGDHYSDSCPEVRTVEERRDIVRCIFCLDMLHTSSRCNKKPKKCNYCHSYDHHTALCERPEEKERLEREYKTLQDRLTILQKEYDDLWF